MSCAQIRERFADPRPVDEVDGAALEEHLEGCDECRGAARAYAAIERLYRPEKAGEPPADFDARVRSRIADAPRPKAAPAAALRRVPLPALVGGGAALLILAAFLAWPKKPAPAPAAPPSTSARKAKAPAPRAEEAPPPAILAVGNAPLDVNAPQLTKAERAHIAEMYDADFLLFEDTLGAIDAFYPEDLRIGPALPETAPPPPAARPAETADARELRMLSWRSMSKQDRERAERADAEHRKLPAWRRAALERRWTSVSWFPDDEKIGIRRLVSRLAELGPARVAQLTAQIRAVAAEPVERRGELWRALPFAKSLTGQERTAGERLLICR